MQKLTIGEILMRMGRPRKKPRHPYGEWLKWLRDSRQLSQQQVAAHLSDTGKMPLGATSTISHWEMTGEFPGRDFALKLCELYGIPLETLFCVKKAANGKYLKNDAIVESSLKDLKAKELADQNDFVKMRLKQHAARIQKLIDANEDPKE